MIVAVQMVVEEKFFFFILLFFVCVFSLKCALQVIVAVQMVVEEKFLTRYNVHALEAVGWEGKTLKVAIW